MDLKQTKTYIIGNWKMNPASEADAEEMFDEVEDEVYKIDDEKVEVVICPPFVFLSNFDSDGKVKLGAQDIFWENSGAFTGEISADMLRRLGVRYAIIGHSERRQYLGETDEMVNLKIKAALAGKVRPILCIGETLEERQRGDTGEIIVNQVEKALTEIPEKDLIGNLVIAYEPIWAIGSGAVPSPDEVMSIGLLIKKILAKIYGNRVAAESVPILYGGSVNRDNAFDLVDKTGLSGLLIGGASLKPREFVEIVRRFAK
ncbi:MAG: triose-phosphate isomerase [Candidatus Pacebacteria bacterium]|nr:triose-phosphate isomerase [Candidatus Paceibacterota bacterium]